VLVLLLYAWCSLFWLSFGKSYVLILILVCDVLVWCEFCQTRLQFEKFITDVFKIIILHFVTFLVDFCFSVFIITYYTVTHKKYVI